MHTGKFILRACSSVLLLKLPGSAALHLVASQPVTRLTLLINTHRSHQTTLIDGFSLLRTLIYLKGHEHRRKRTEEGDKQGWI